MTDRGEEFYDGLENVVSEETIEAIDSVREITTELIEKFKEGDCDYHATMITMLVTIFEYVRTHTCGDENCGEFIIRSSFKLAEAIAESEEENILH